MSEQLKYCKYCGEKIPMDAVICTHCGRQVEELKAEQPDIIVNNNNINQNINDNDNRLYGGYYDYGIPKSKWISLALCIFTVCGHKFYEGKIGMGFLYLFTVGLCGFGWIYDIIKLIFSPNPYFVYPRRY